MRRSILAAVFVLIAAPASFAQPPTQESEEPLLPPPQTPEIPPADSQPIFTTPTEARQSLRSLFGPTRSGEVRERLVRAPAMFGDFYRMAPTLTMVNPVPDSDLGGTFRTQTSLLSGDWSGLKVAENNSAVPTDRFYFAYNHHQNAFSTFSQANYLYSQPQTFARQYALDRYTLAMEKTLFGGSSSLAVRIPFANQPNFTSAFTPPYYVSPVGQTFFSGAGFGNVSLIYKQLLYADEGFAFSGGMGMQLPTGGNASAGSGPNIYTLHNNALHLDPYLAFLRNSDDDGFFLTGFAQLDFATSSNRLSAVNVPTLNSPSTAALRAPYNIGDYTPQSLLHLSLGGGYWFYRNDGARFLPGLAGLLELHYASTLQNADVLQRGNLAQVTAPYPTPNASYAVLTQKQNRFDILNLTTGLNLLVDQNSVLRVGVAVPLRTGGNRLFDAELLVQFTRFL